MSDKDKKKKTPTVGVLVSPRSSQFQIEVGEKVKERSGGVKPGEAIHFSPGRIKKLTEQEWEFIEGHKEHKKLVGSILFLVPVKPGPKKKKKPLKDSESKPLVPGDGGDKKKSSSKKN